MKFNLQRNSGAKICYMDVSNHSVNSRRAAEASSAATNPPRASGSRTTPALDDTQLVGPLVNLSKHLKLKLENIDELPALQKNMHDLIDSSARSDRKELAAMHSILAEFVVSNESLKDVSNRTSWLGNFVDTKHMKIMQELSKASLPADSDPAEKWAMEMLPVSPMDWQSDAKEGIKMLMGERPPALAKPEAGESEESIKEKFAAAQNAILENLTPDQKEQLKKFAGIKESATTSLSWEQFSNTAASPHLSLAPLDQSTDASLESLREPTERTRLLDR